MSIFAATYRATLSNTCQSIAHFSAAGLNLYGGYLFSPFLVFTVDFTGLLEPTFALLFGASTAAIRVSALSISAAWRALCVALRWLARRFISLALWAPSMASSIDGCASYSRAHFLL